MEISLNTKIAALISQYPFLRNYLISLNPHFKALENPIMLKTVGRIATISQAALMGGMDAGELLEGIVAEIKRQTGEEISVKLPEPKSLRTPEERQEILKSIIRDLHKGVDVQILKKRFLDLINEVSPQEIAQMEQKLIAEGMPEEEIKRLCNVHVEVFREALEKKAVPGLPAGHPVHTFMLENRIAEGIIQEIEGLTTPERLSELLDKLSAIHLHYLRKENQLFPLLEKKGIVGPSKVMWSLHDDIRAQLKALKSSPGLDERLNNLLTALKDMIYKEEHILFPMALETLSEEEWYRVKRGEKEIGFAWLKEVEDWHPLLEGAIPPLSAEKIGSLNLDTGQVTPEQINLILTHLPVDISFVNEDDEVVYYSQTKERIFPRSPGIIGRKVQNCHPPKSVDIVEKILKAFKNGERDKAEFWIQSQGRFIHILYLAVRDHTGRYRGTLEVSQDISALRNLSGEKRLLDWD